MTYDPTLPFVLPERPPVTQIRGRAMADLLKGPPARTQPMAGFDAQYGDIVDYIVRITEEIWRDRMIGRIYETYDASCTVYTASGVVRSVFDSRVRTRRVELELERLAVVAVRAREATGLIMTDIDVTGVRGEPQLHVRTRVSL